MELKIISDRGVGSYLNLGGQVVLWVHNLPPLVDLLLPNLPTHLLCPCIIKVIEYVGKNDKLLYYIDAPSQVHSHVKMF